MHMKEISIFHLKRRGFKDERIWNLKYINLLRVQVESDILSKDGIFKDVLMR